MSLKDKVLELCRYSDEQEWFEFKENWFQPDELGEYVSAMSNAAAFHLHENAYFIWGVNDKTHEITGTTFNPYRSSKDGPYQNYLARNLYPSINFSFNEIDVDGKRVVVLVIPAATEVPTSFKEKRYIRIGSSKVNIRNYPKREIQLFRILDGRINTIETLPARYQNLTFSKLFGYYGSRGISLREETFEKNLGLRTSDGEYNIMAQLLSDDSHIPLRVSIFEGEGKDSTLLTIREFGNNCLLYSLDDLLRYGNLLNMAQIDETDRIVERKEVMLFDEKAFREAVVNAVLHNYWAGWNEPMISVFSDRIEILSRGTLSPAQTVEGFYKGESVPVNEKLSEIFLQLHISEKSGRGVPVITGAYGRGAVEFREKSIAVTIPFNRINRSVGTHVTQQREEADSRFDALNPRRQAIIREMKQNPTVTKPRLAEILGISVTAVENNISFLRDNGFIERVGKTKGGFWRVRDI
jgi:ATP-dependent DNA helicase RecG